MPTRRRRRRARSVRARKLSSSELVEVPPKTPAKSEAKEPIERTDDPVHMYLREMRSIGLLSRQGEVAIAKRIEAGREAMIAGLCESPLTFQAVTIWRNELNFFFFFFFFFSSSQQMTLSVVSALLLTLLMIIDVTAIAPYMQ